MSNSFNTTPAKVIQNYLIDQGLVTDPADESAWPAYYSQRPPSPDDCVTLYDTDGQHDGRSMIDGAVFYHYGVQIITRAANVVDGYMKAHAILLDFDEEVNQTLVPIGSDTYQIQSISRTSAVISLGREPGSSCHLHSSNIIVSLKLLSGTGSY